MINWNNEFKSAHLESRPTASLSMSSEIYRRDKKDVDGCAKSHGYEKVLETPKIVRFWRPN